MCQDVAYQLMQQATQAEAVSCISGSILMLVSRLIHLSNKVKRGGANTKWGCAMWAGNWKRFVIEPNCEFVMACRKVKEVDKGTLVR